MKRTKTHYLTQKSDKKLVARHYILQAIMIVMFSIVLYDSIIHKTPFYYICFFFLGVFVGRLIAGVERVIHVKEHGKFVMESNYISILVLLLLLLVRFYIGRYVLDLAHVIWTTDAIYLLFTGIYWSKVQNTVRQIDEITYGWLKEKE